jgi:hypothetical protein
VAHWRLVVLKGTILATGVMCIVAVVGGLDPKAGSSSVFHVQIRIRTLEWVYMGIAAIVAVAVAMCSGCLSYSTAGM